jgi:ERCC4-type nuclease
MPKEFKNDVDVEVLIDTREQQPLEFDKSKILKLDFGDYTLGGNDFSNTFVDRKSSGDFLSTFGGQVDRFRREMERCVELDSYMYIVVEKSIKAIEKEAVFTKGRRAPKLGWVFSNLISVQHEFAGHCQFVFTDNRKHSEEIIPKLLYLGDKLWNVDVQYFLDKEER